jgi:hypothetical protein
MSDISNGQAVHQPPHQQLISCRKFTMEQGSVAQWIGVRLLG